MLRNPASDPISESGREETKHTSSYEFGETLGKAAEAWGETNATRSDRPLCRFPRKARRRGRLRFVFVRLSGPERHMLLQVVLEGLYPVRHLVEQISVDTAFSVTIRRHIAGVTPLYAMHDSALPHLSDPADMT